MPWLRKRSKIYGIEKNGLKFLYKKIRISKISLEIDAINFRSQTVYRKLYRKIVSLSNLSPRIQFFSALKDFKEN